MKFLRKIEELNHTFGSDSCGFYDRALLYGVFDSPPPLAEHIVYKPAPGSLVQEMVHSYKLCFPKELLELYQAINGADLFWTVHFVGSTRIRIPVCCFSIYGIPITYDRSQVEPYSIVVEDLNRPDGTPNTWLKFASYCKLEDIDNRIDLFVDTEKFFVCAIEHDNPICHIVEKWNSIDDCLCSVFTLLSLHGLRKTVDGSLSSETPQKNEP